MIDFDQEFLKTRGGIPVVIENVLDRKPGLLAKNGVETIYNLRKIN